MTEEYQNIQDQEITLADELRQAYQALLNNVMISNKLLSQETEEDDILSLLLSITRLIIDFEAGAVFRYEGGSYQQVSAMDLNSSFEKIRDNYFSEGIYEWATTQKRTLVMPEGENNTHILVPIITEKSNIGILDLQVTISAEDIRNQDLDLLWVVVSNASSRCEQIKLNRWSGLVDVLLSTLEKVNSSEELETLFNGILKGLNQLLFCSRYLLLLKQNKKFIIKARYDDGKTYCIQQAYNDEKKCSFVEQSIKEKKVIRIPSFTDDKTCSPCPYADKRPRTDSYLMIVPLIVNAECHGAITIIDDSYNSKLFTDDSQHIVEIFANQVSIAIYQAQLRDELQVKNAKINKEIKMASSVQQSLLPEIIKEYKFSEEGRILCHYKKNNITITGFYQPCSSLGGDFYDMIEDSENLSLTIADVSGHGLSSSLITALFKMALHKFINEKGLSTNDICHKLNTDLCKFIKTGDYITAFLGKLNKESKTFKYTSAGHPYPLLFKKAENEIELLQANGLPFAMLENQQYPKKEALLNPGDKLILYTDGITEAINSDLIMYRKEKLIETTKKFAHLKEDKFISAIIDDVVKFTSSSTFSDDISILIIEIDE